MNSYIGDKALLLGNGIHRTGNNNGISWGALLEKISSNFGISIDLKNDLKPFPLAFEEMLYAKEGRNDFQSKLRNIKTRISDLLIEDANRLINNDVHKGFMQSGINEIITTNYDYNLESSIIPDFLNSKLRYSINNQESKHSLYRGYKINNVNVRHIHGELRHNRKILSSDESYPEESIMIGFEHYSEYFAKIQNVTKGESGKHKEEEKKSLLVRLRDNETGKIWTDLFFTHQLIFAGFSLDFSESHLWWLLLHREELKRKGNKYKVNINNEIIFCTPNISSPYIDYDFSSKEKFEQLYKIKLNEQKSKGITDVLRSLGIIIDSIDCKSYKEFYLKVIEKYS